MENECLSIKEKKAVIYNKIRVLFDGLVKENDDLFNNLSDCRELIFEFCAVGIESDEVWFSQTFKELLLLSITVKTKMDVLQSFVMKKLK